MPINHTKRKKIPSFTYKEMYEIEYISAVNSMSINNPNENLTQLSKKVHHGREMPL